MDAKIIQIEKMENVIKNEAEADGKNSFSVAVKNGITVAGACTGALLGTGLATGIGMALGKSVGAMVGYSIGIVGGGAAGLIIGHKLGGMVANEIKDLD